MLDFEGNPVYMQQWVPNFNPKSLVPYDEAIWLRLYNLPMEHWLEERLEKLGNNLGALIELDNQIMEGNSYLYVRLKIEARRPMPKIIKLKSMARIWEKEVETERKKLYYRHYKNGVMK